MKTYIWVMLLILALDSLGKASRLADGSASEPRDPRVVAADLAINAGLCIWAAYLLGAAS